MTLQLSIGPKLSSKWGCWVGSGGVAVPGPCDHPKSQDTGQCLLRRLPLKLNPAFQEDPPSNRKSSSWSSVFFLGSLLSTATEDNTSEQSWTNTYFPSFLSYTYRKVNPSAYTCIFFSILNCYCTGQQPATGGEEFINTVHQQCGLWLVI